MKLGGLCYLSNFRNDMFGGLRSNRPGRKEFLLPEYWQGGRVSCYAADIWAAAVSLYVLVKGVDPFPIDRLDRHMERMSHCRRRIPMRPWPYPDHQIEGKRQSAN